MRNRLFPIILVICFAFFFSCDFLFAEKIAVVYTGNTSASLYPCQCPKAPNGGIARRATKIKQLKKDYPNLIFLDGGNFFASGPQDIDILSPELDRMRTDIYFRGMESMGYDAVNIGRDEFNFGKEFLVEKIKTKKIKFLSCNLGLPNTQAYVLKKVGKMKIGIIGVSPLEIKTEDFEFKQEPQETLKKVQSSVEDLKKKKADIVILLSQLGQDLDKQLAEQIKGIDIIINNQTNMGTAEKLNSAIYLTPFPWGRILGVLELNIEKGKIQDSTRNNIPLGSDIADDEEIKSFLPVCFKDSECYKPNFIGKCLSPGEQNAICANEPITKVHLTVITANRCRTCNVENALQMIGGRIPIGEVYYIDSSSQNAKELIEKLSIDLLPAYILTEEVSKHPNYQYLLGAKIIEKKDNYYLLNPAFVGMSYFLKRPRLDNKLDLFLSLRDKNSKSVLEKTKDLIKRLGNKIDFRIHFLAKEDKKLGNFSAPFGDIEIVEDRQALCVMDKYPQKMWEYLLCHVGNLGKDCLSICSKNLGLDGNKIKKCIDSDESINLLKNNTRLVEELKISYGPLFLLNNQEIFGIKEDTTIEELEKIVK